MQPPNKLEDNTYRYNVFSLTVLNLYFLSFFLLVPTGVSGLVLGLQFFPPLGIFFFFMLYVGNAVTLIINLYLAYRLKRNYVRVSFLHKLVIVLSVLAISAPKLYEILGSPTWDVPNVAF